MNQHIYTYADISVSDYQFERITELSLVKEMNEHVKLSISGVIPENLLDKYVEQADANDMIEVILDDEERSQILFKGIITNMSVHAINDVRYLRIEALSSTIKMDICKESRSYQNKQLTYGNLFKDIVSSYPNSDVIADVLEGKAIGDLLVQYKETDWNFLKRLASHFHTMLIPMSSHQGVKLYVGAPTLGEPLELDEYNYSIRKDLREFQLKSKNGVNDLDEQNSISYTVYSHKVFELGSTVRFKQRTLYVSRVETTMENGLLNNQYVLRDRKGLSCRTEYCYALAGTSLFGSILDVAKDKVKVKLAIDQGQSVQEAMWFSYSTVYSSPDGSGWYCMPEVGDEVRLYFPDEQEKNAFAASSVDTESSDPVKRSDPSVKSISTKYGKQIVFKPGSVEIIGSGQLLMRLTDDGGIEINSDKKISLTAAEDIEITGGAKILIQGEAGIEMIQANASLKIEDDVTMNGGKVNVE